jgi:hypothetical protein
MAGKWREIIASRTAKFDCATAGLGRLSATIGRNGSIQEGNQGAPLVLSGLPVLLAARFRV